MAGNTSIPKLMGSGIIFDLASPDPRHINIDIDVAEALARIARFDGHVRSGPWSVAQHSVVGADALMRETGRADYAAAFLLHDGHEAYMGDITRPAQLALQVWAGRASLNNQMLTGLGRVTAAEAVTACVKSGLDALRFELDAAIYTAAGLAWPLPGDVAAAVAHMDERMLATEARLFFVRGPEQAEALGPRLMALPVVNMKGRMRIWPWPEAADEFRDRLQRYLPRHKPRRGRAVTSLAPIRKRRLSTPA